MADQVLSDVGGKVLIDNRGFCRAAKVSEGTLYPGQPCIKGTAAHQVTQAAEDALNVIGVVEVQDNVDPDTAIVAASDIYTIYYLTTSAIVYGMIMANIEAIVQGDRLTVASESGKWRGHPDDLTIDVAGADTVTKNTFTGYREQASSVMAMDTLAKDASDDNYIAVMV